MKSLFELAPRKAIDVTKSCLYAGIPYRLSQTFERIARPEAVEPARNLARSAREFQAIFIHVPKVAGISLRNTLFGDAHFNGHYDIRDFRMILPRNEFDRFYKFCFVRNPWDRVYSAFTYLSCGGRNEQDRAWSARELYAISGFRDFVMNRLGRPAIQRSIHFRPQYAWISDTRGVPLVDMVGRYEYLARDFGIIRDRLGVSGELAWENRSIGRKADYREVYEPEMIATVADIYHHDIELFEYEFCDSEVSACFE